MGQAEPDVRIALFALEHLGIKLGLEQMHTLVALLGAPDQAFPAIVVAGTNGKGSVSAMVERGLRAAGYRTGRYTSPHLITIEERIAIDGESLAPAVFDRVARRVLTAAEALPAPPSFFEATTAVALEAFRDARVDVAILEVGLGGRLDATNVVTPIAVAITAIDFDHEEYLGHTLPAIAAEKAGVIKPGAVVVLAANPPEVDAVIARACRHTGATLVRAAEVTADSVSFDDGHLRMELRTPRRSYPDLRLALRGRHQAQNAAVAVRLLEEIDGRAGLTTRSGDIRAGIESAVWPARLEDGIVDGISVLVDGAHNPAGASALAAFLAEAYGAPLPMVIGVMRDKPVDAILAALSPMASHWVMTAAATDRASDPRRLAEAARRIAPAVPVAVVDDPRGAVHHAAAFGTPVIVAGSLYLAGEIRAYFP